MLIRFWMLLTLALLCLNSAFAQQVPVDGIRDDTHALSDASHQMLAQEMATLGADLGCSVWLSAGTFLASGQTLKNHALETRLAWSGQADAVLLAYDRSGDTQSLSFSPAFWKRYSTSGLIRLIQQGGLIMADKSRTPEERLKASMKNLIEGLRALERERIISAQTFTRDHARLARFFGVCLLAGAALLACLAGFKRRHDTRAAAQAHFPKVQVAQRLGAACGGGVTVVWSPAQSPES